MSAHRWQPTLVATAAICLMLPTLFTASEQPSLSNEEIKEFLLAAKVIGSKRTGKGTTQPWRLTLSDGKLTHDAHFEEIDEHKDVMRFANGRTEFNFVDSYKYNIAAYQLAELIGLDDLLPMYVERKWQDKVGSISWWLPVKMDEADRLKQHIPVPDPDGWNKQMYKVRVFDQLVYDEDANLTNVVIGEDWRIWRIDFTRAFRRSKDLQAPKDLVRCDRQLFAKLKTLNGNELAARTKGYLTNAEVQAVMARRDKIVAQFEKLIAEKGEDTVLY